MDVAPAFIDETGVLRGSLTRNPVYGIGLLVINDPGGLTDSLYQLHFSFRAGRSEQRRQLRHSLLRENRSPSPAELDRLFWSTRHHEYKFAEVNGHNLQEYVDLLNLFFSFGDVEFHALLLDRTRPGFNLEPWNFDEWAAYVALTCGVVRAKSHEGCVRNPRHARAAEKRFLLYGRQGMCGASCSWLSAGCLRDVGLPANRGRAFGVRAVRLEGPARTLREWGQADSGEEELDSFRQEQNRAGSWGGHPATIGGLSEDNQSVTVHSPIA